MTALQIIDYFRKYGNNEYGDLSEDITQTEHAIQAGLAAQKDGASLELQLAAFLHDLGHLAGLKTGASKMDQFGIKNHEEITRQILKKAGFSDLVSETAGNHVKAKRYLFSTQEDYYSQLSEASQETLKRQGGLMSSEEIKEFQKSPYFKESLLIRKYDDLAKDPNWLKDQPDREIKIQNYLNHFQKLVSKHLKLT